VSGDDSLQNRQAWNPMSGVPLRPLKKIMNPLLRIVFPNFLLMSAVAFGADPAELTILQEQFTTQVSTIRQDASQKSKLAQKTYLDAVDAAQRQLAASGDLDGALAAKAERERAASGTAIEPAKRKTLPPIIQRELLRYEQAVTPVAQTGALAERKAREQYLAALARLQQQFTQSNELEKAVAVRRTRERIESEAIASGTTLVAATPPPGANTLQLSSYYDRLAKALRSPKKTNAIGSRREGKEFSALPTEGAHLVGVAIKQGEWFGAPIISSLQPIFETRNGRVRGPLLGKPTENLPIVSEAKPGYVVSELLVSGPGDHVHGIKLVFRKLDFLRQSLLPHDTYESDWLVLELEKKSARVGDPTRPAIGLCGRAGDWIGAIGLLQAP
jgi:hypothetical protein